MAAKMGGTAGIRSCPSWDGIFLFFQKKKGEADENETMAKRLHSRFPNPF